MRAEPKGDITGTVCSRREGGRRCREHRASCQHPLPGSRHCSRLAHLQGDGIFLNSRLQSEAARLRINRHTPPTLAAPVLAAPTFGGPGAQPPASLQQSCAPLNDTLFFAQWVPPPSTGAGVRPSHRHMGCDVQVTPRRRGALSPHSAQKGLALMRWLCLSVQLSVRIQ